MRRLETHRLDGFNETPVDPPATFDVTLLGGKALSYDALVSNIPAITTEYDNSLDPQIRLSVIDGPELWDPVKNYPVSRLSTAHGRNVEVASEQTTITDSFGNEFHNIGIKGSDFKDPKIIEWQPADRGYIVHGLQESIVMERVLRASKLLRERGVDTEYIIGLALPEQYLIPTSGGIDDVQALPIRPFVEQAVNRYVAERADSSPDSTQGNTFKEKVELVDKLHDIEYIVSLRAMSTPYRLNELGLPSAFKAMFEQLAQRTDNPAIMEYFEEYGYWTYVVYELTRNIGENVAGLHNQKLVHGFLHAGNINGLGGIVDLDSVRGEPLGLGDETITVAEQAKDVYDAIGCIELLTKPNDLRQDPGSRSPVLQFHANAIQTFLGSYFEQRKLDSTEREEFLAELLKIAANELQENCLSFREFIIPVHMYYLSTRPQEEGIDIPSLIKHEPVKREASPYFSLLPTSYLQAQTNIFEESFVYKDTIKVPMLMLALKDQYYRQLVDKYRNKEISARQLLWMSASGEIRDTVNAPDIVENAFAPLARQQIKENLQNLINNDLTPKNNALKKLLETKPEFFNDKLAALDLGDGIKADVVFVENPEQRDKVMKALIQTSKSLDIQELGEFNFEEVDNKDGVIFIGPKFLVNDFAMAEDSETFIRIIEHFNWPFFTVVGAGTDKMVIYEMGKQEDDPSKDQDELEFTWVDTDFDDMSRSLTLTS